jgi:hypothetical protein
MNDLPTLPGQLLEASERAAQDLLNQVDADSPGTPRSILEGAMRWDLVVDAALPGHPDDSLNTVNRIALCFVLGLKPTGSACEQRVMNTTVSLPMPQEMESLYADPPAPYLDPDVLSAESKRAAEAFAVEGTSPNTRRTYQTALLYWGAWYALRYGRQLTAPVSVPTVIQFILDHLEHNPLEEPVEPSVFVPSARTTQHVWL